jgi:uncharacterized protein (DUF305 family)
MNTVSTVRRALLAGAAAIATLALLDACGGSDMGGMDHGSGQRSNSAPPDASFNDADVQFAQMMIPHHQQAVQMATLAQSKASDPELKQLAAQIKAAQDPEISTMTGWLAAWGKPSAAAGGHDMQGMSGMPGMMSEQEMTALAGATGVEFDRLFARGMIAHHNGAIQMARDQQANGKNADAKSLAATIAKSQADEVTQLQKILDRL